MKKHTYTREEVKQGLELCAGDEAFNNCVDCPFRFLPLPKCETVLLRQAKRAIEKLERTEKKEFQKNEKSVRTKI